MFPLRFAISFLRALTLFFLYYCLAGRGRGGRFKSSRRIRRSSILCYDRKTALRWQRRRKIFFSVPLLLNLVSSFDTYLLVDRTRPLKQYYPTPFMLSEKIPFLRINRDFGTPPPTCHICGWVHLRRLCILCRANFIVIVRLPAVIDFHVILNLQCRAECWKGPSDTSPPPPRQMWR